MRGCEAVCAPGKGTSNGSLHLLWIDEIVIGLSAAELDQLGGRDAGAVAKSLAGNGTLSVWQYAVRKAPNGDLEQAPLRKIGLIAHDSLRVEPYSTPLKVLPHE